MPPKGVVVKQWSSHIDNIGRLTPIEFKELPLTPVRAFVVTNVPAGAARGGHAHLKTQQYLYCVEGLIKVLLNDGTTNNEFLLEKGQGVLVKEMVWDSQIFLSGKDTLLVFCSTEYNREDYITDFEDFKKQIQIKKQ